MSKDNLPSYTELLEHEEGKIEIKQPLDYKTKDLLND